MSPTPRTVDVVIVGGGPAGSSCAWKLRQAGADVLVLDRAVFPRDKVCAGWITPAVVDAVELDIDDYRNGRTFQPITSFRTSRIGGRVIDTPYAEPVSYGIRRCEFDHYLLARSGAHVEAGRPLTNLRRVDGAWLVNDEIRAPVLVGAGGHFCPVARTLHASAADEPIVAAQEIEFQMTARQAAACRVAPERPELYFCQDLRGYGWCFRKEDYLNVGFGRLGRDRFPAHVRRFVEFLRTQGTVPDDLPTKWRGHAYLLYGSSPRPVLDDGMLLAGDAAGLAYPQSGEGIRTAVESGLLAARILVDAAGNYCRERLEPYREALDARYGGAWSLPFELPLPAPLTAAIGARLLSSPRFTRHVVLDRWFLHAQQAPLGLSAVPRWSRSQPASREWEHPSVPAAGGNRRLSGTGDPHRRPST